jgi:ubiquinone/menaquinone biosynthesis C-methylase UbiE
LGVELDFGYPWWLSYGHLVIALPAIALTGFAGWQKWPRWSVAVFGVLALWASVAFLLIHFGVNINSRATLPTESFLSQGYGKVLDLGAGTGRSSIMVLAARPQASLVALDLFATSFEGHFGKGLSPQERLKRNLVAAGVEGRTTIETSDMRKLRFGDGSFDALVSSYAVDHLNREGVGQALAEAARVVKPGGDFLLSLVSNDRWVKFAFGPLLSHGGTRGREWWTTKLREAQFEVVETGNSPATLWLLARRR